MSRSRDARRADPFIVQTDKVEPLGDERPVDDGVRRNADGEQICWLPYCDRAIVDPRLQRRRAPQDRSCEGHSPNLRAPVNSEHMWRTVW